MPAVSLEPPATSELPAAPAPRRVPRRLPPGSSQAGWAACAVLAWVYLLAFPRNVPPPGLDASWQAIVTKAGTEHWAFGRQIMLNYGPWAYLGDGFYHAPSFMTYYLFELGSAAVLVALVGRVGCALPVTARWPFFAASLVTGILESDYAGTLAIVYAGWLTSEDRTRTGRLIGGAGVVFAAVEGLMKTYYIVLGQGVFVCVLARHVLRGRGRPASWRAGVWPLLLFEACLCADWLLAGQKPADLPAFLRGAAELAGGHSRAMGFDPSLTIRALALALLVWTGGVGAWRFRRGPRANRLAALPLAALFAGSLFMAWKQGVTRADSYHLSGYLCFVAVFITTVPLFFEPDTLAPRWHHLNVGGV